MQEKRIYNLKYERIKIAEDEPRTFCYKVEQPAQVDLREKLPPVNDQ